MATKSCTSWSIPAATFESIWTGDDMPWIHPKSPKSAEYCLEVVPEEFTSLPNSNLHTLKQSKPSIISAEQLRIIERLDENIG